MSQGQRKLAAIMFTDMVGYTTLSQSNEALAMQLLEEHRKIVRPCFPKHNGREIKTMGDAFLVEFASALEAVRCAFELQQSFQERNSDRPLEKKILLRIGVHLGDVVHSQDDVYGDAVNVASRIEPLAKAGGICVTEQVYDQVKNKFEFPFSSLGKKELKNVSGQIKVYSITLPWQKLVKQSSGPLRIAVLPFTNMSPDPNDEYFADGMTEEVISTLSKIQNIDVISRTSVMQYKKNPKPIREVSQELDVAKVLEGSVRKAGAKLRITVQLIDADMDRHEWAESYDRELKDAFAVQSDIAERVAQSMEVSLRETERVKIEKPPTKNMAAYENYLMGIHLIQRGTPSSTRDSVKCLEDSVKGDPGFSKAYAALGNVYVYLAGELMPARPAFERADQLITKALELDENSSDAHLAKGNLAMQYHLAWHLAEEEFKKAIELNPSNAFAHSWYSVLLRVLDRIEEASIEAERARELDPLSAWTQGQVHECLAAKRDWNGATAVAERIVQLEPDNALCRLMLARAYFRAGRRKEAEKELLAAERVTAALDSKVDLARTFALLDDQNKARELLSDIEGERREHYSSPSRLSLVYALLGDKESALKLLAEDFEESTMGFLLAYKRPELDTLREDPRFLILMARLNLPNRQLN